MQPENQINNNSVQVQPQTVILYSNRVARYAAVFLDGLILGIIQLIISGVFVFPLSVSSAAPTTSLGVSVLLLFIRLFISPLYFWLSTHYYGKTFGKKFFGLEIIDEKTGGRLGLWRSFMREVTGKFISDIVFNLGNFWILWDKKRQGWHDKFAHDIVIQKYPLVGIKKVIAYILFVLGIILPIIAIIGIMLTIVLVGVNPSSQLQKAKDVKVEADITQIGSAMNVFHDQNGYYPDKIEFLVLDKDLSSYPMAPSDYLPYFVNAYPVGCTTGLKNCKSVVVGGQLKSPKISGYNYYCFYSITGGAVEASSCTR